MDSWIEFEKRFKELSPSINDTRLDGQEGVAGEYWRLTGAYNRESNREFELLSTLAGEKLTKIWRDAPDKQQIINHEDPKIRWYRALKNYSGTYEAWPPGFVRDESGNELGTITVGSIHNIGKVSANFCLQLEHSDPLPKKGKSWYEDLVTIRNIVIAGLIIAFLTAWLGL